MKFEILSETLIKQIPRDNKIPRESLSPSIFQFFDDGRPPILHDSIKFQIGKDLSSLGEVAPITDAHMVGELLTPYFADNSNIEIYVSVDPEAIDNLATAGIFWNLKRLQGKYAVGTTHKIYYFMRTQEIDLNQVDAAYDVINERWLKRPEPVNPSVNEIITDFNETMMSIDNESGKIIRDKISIDKIRDLNKSNLQVLRHYIQKIYDGIEENLRYVVEIIPDNHAIKRLLNDDTLTLIELQTYGQSLPEFVRSLFFKKFYYIKFIQRLDDMLISEDEFDVKALISKNPVGNAFKKA